MSKSSHVWEGVHEHVESSSCESELLRRIDESALSLELKGRERFLDVQGSATVRALPVSLLWKVRRRCRNVWGEGRQPHRGSLASSAGQRGEVLVGTYAARPGREL